GDDRGNRDPADGGTAPSAAHQRARAGGQVPPADPVPDRLPGAADLGPPVGLQGGARDHPQPLRPARGLAVGEFRRGVERRPLRPLPWQQRHLHGRHRRRRRGALDVRRLRPGDAAPARPRRPAGPLPARADGAVPVVHDPALLPPARHPPARDLLGLHPARDRLPTAVRHLPDARLLPWPAERVGRRGPGRRGQRVADLPPGDPAAGGAGTRRPGHLPVRLGLARVPDAARLRPDRGPAPGQHRDHVLLRPLHRPARPDRRRRHDRDDPDGRHLPAPPAPLHRGHHRRGAQVV
ncbi:MAG: ABC transporter, permease protein 2 (cluster 1, maltose/g3p/polyamine/iron), partial [uncultured Thermomicrobiales bacterium]